MGYLHVYTPCVGTVDLYKTSGHWDHYKENMFPSMKVDEVLDVLSSATVLWRYSNAAAVHSAHREYIFRVRLELGIANAK